MAESKRAGGGGGVEGGCSPPNCKHNDRMMGFER